MDIDMISMPLPSSTTSRRFSSICERNEHGLLILTHPGFQPERRVLFVNSYGGRTAWERIKRGLLPPHHFWGCLELLEHGYEIGIAEPISHFTFRRPLPHDWNIFCSAQAWLRPHDVLYCGHTLLYWVPMLHRLGRLKCKLVSVTYARETLDFAKFYHGIVALTPAAAERAREMSPGTKVQHLGWGVDLDFFPPLPFDGQWLLSCGRTLRDHQVLNAAANTAKVPIRIVAPSLPSHLQWPPSVMIKTGGNADDTISYSELLTQYYAQCAGSLIVLQPDPGQRHAVGYTNLIEAMAMARPVIVTKTGALGSEIDVEAAGCGIQVPANDSHALGEAMERLLGDPHLAQSLGNRGRKLCESKYNIRRFARDLDKFFQSL